MGNNYINIKDKKTDEEKEIECSYHHIITNDLKRLEKIFSYRTN